MLTVRHLHTYVYMFVFIVELEVTASVAHKSLILL